MVALLSTHLVANLIRLRLVQAVLHHITLVWTGQPFCHVTKPYPSVCHLKITGEMAFKLSCGLIILLLAAVTRSSFTELAPVGVFRTAHPDMSRADLYHYQGRVDDWYGTIGSIVQGVFNLLNRSSIDI
ncbi:hypothetical protein H4Q26_006665 [Puccinia striiformis f. sp. tritici PST-130]|nr:hypothetical protein H4Q26_006665 [Puccinia striiformis f. sp. tritici PST-130]